MSKKGKKRQANEKSGAAQAHPQSSSQQQPERTDSELAPFAVRTAPRQQCNSLSLPAPRGQTETNKRRCKSSSGRRVAPSRFYASQPKNGGRLRQAIGERCCRQRMRSAPLRCALAAILALLLVLHLSFAVNATSDNNKAITIADLRAAQQHQPSSLGEASSIASRAPPPSPPIASATAIINRAIPGTSATATDADRQVSNVAPPRRAVVGKTTRLELASASASELPSQPMRTTPFPVVMLAHARPGRLNVTLTSLLGVRGIDRSCLRGGLEPLGTS